MKSNQKNKTKVVSVRMSLDEYAQIKSLAEQAGYKSLGAYLRRQGKQQLTVCMNEEPQQKMLALINRISANVNQIAKRVNTTGTIYQSDIDELKKGVKEIWQQQVFMQSELQKLVPWSTS